MFFGEGGSLTSEPSQDTPLLRQDAVADTKGYNDGAATTWLHMAILAWRLVIPLTT